jgi:hypothetical protein
MKNTDPHPVELLILAAVVTIEALAVLTVALVALLLTITRSRPAGSPARVMTPPPIVHPLAVVAADLEALPVTQLRPMAGTRSKRIRKAELVAALVAC